jgi:hypothetical protein
MVKIFPCHPRPDAEAGCRPPGAGCLQSTAGQTPGALPGFGKYPGACAVGTQLADVFAVKVNAAGAHGLHARQGAQKRGFAGAIGTHQRHSFAPMHFQTDALERLDAAIAAFHALHASSTSACATAALGGSSPALWAPRPTDSGASADDAVVQLTKLGLCLTHQTAGRCCPERRG